MTPREEYLLRQAYEAGFTNAVCICEDQASLTGTLQDESERWVNEVIADSGDTVGQFICHEAPKLNGSEL